jgi:hypothetical protein
MIVLLFWRPVNRGRSVRGFLGPSLSASDDELAEDGGLARPSALGFEAALGRG